MNRVGPSLSPRIFHTAFSESATPARPRGERLLATLTIGSSLIDVAVVLGAFLLAYWVRFIVPDAEAAALQLHEYARIGLFVGLATIVLLAPHGLYDAHRRLTWTVRGHAVVSAVSTALILAVTVSWALGDQRFSRLWFAAGWLFAVLGLIVWRSLAQRLVQSARMTLAPANRAVIVGANPLGQQVADELSGRFRVLGYVDNGSDLAAHTELPLLGPIAHLSRLVHELDVDELIITLPSDRRDQVTTVIARGFQRHVKVKLIPDLGDLLPQTCDIHHMSGRPYIGFSPVAQVHGVKRLMDLLLTPLGLLVTWPLFLLIALAIKLDSPGPVVYRQVRVGKDGRLFEVMKFRSMYQDADRRRAALLAANEADGPLFKIRNDPRITRVGKLLRRTSLDELPQVFNVLRGEMSLVGPRPPLPSEVEEYEEWQLGRLRAVPGMTGLWQVSGRSDVSFHDMVRLDLHYIRNWSLQLDLEILWRTIPAVVGSRGAF